MAAGIRRLVAPALIVLFVSPPGAVSAGERRGADVSVSRKNRLLVSGELVAVRQDSLLLLNQVGQEASVKFTEISSIKVLTKALGGLVGEGIGAAAGRDLTIVFEGLSEAEAQDAKARLRGMARMRTAQ